MNSINFIIVLFLSIFFQSCSTEQPGESEVKNIVKQWYYQESLGDGAGSWYVEGVTVLRILKDAERKNVFNTTNLVSGTRKQPPLGEPLPDEKFTDTLRMDLEWNGAKWITVIQ